MAHSFAVAFYHSGSWKRARAEAMRRDHGLCQRCLSFGKVTPAEIVHHIIELTPENITDPAIATGLSNLTSLCRVCHADVHGYTNSRTREGLTFDDEGNLVPLNPQTETQQHC